MKAPLLHPGFTPGWSLNLPDSIDAVIAKLRGSIRLTEEPAPPVPTSLADLVKSGPAG